MKTSHNFIDLSGERFGILQVMERAENQKRKTRWKCLCECGNETIIPTNDLRSGKTKSCGCRQNCGTHGLTNKHYLYYCWRNIKTRCLNSNHPSYSDYGGRGILMCEEWKDNFITFKDYILSTLGERPLLHSLDRIDNDGDYRPGNVRWADRQTQQQNRRKQNV